MKTPELPLPAESDQQAIGRYIDALWLEHIRYICVLAWSVVIPTTVASTSGQAQ
jgi:hypothetical protein